MPTLVNGWYKRYEVVKIDDLAGGMLCVIINRRHKHRKMPYPFDREFSVTYEVTEVLLDEEMGWRQKMGMGSLSSFTIKHEDIRDCVGIYRYRS